MSPVISEACLPVTVLLLEFTVSTVLLLYFLPYCTLLYCAVLQYCTIYPALLCHSQSHHCVAPRHFWCWCCKQITGNRRLATDPAFTASSLRLHCLLCHTPSHHHSCVNPCYARLLLLPPRLSTHFDPPEHQRQPTRRLTLAFLLHNLGLTMSLCQNRLSEERYA